MICDKLHNTLATIMHGETEEEKLDSAKQIAIKSCRRLGRFSRNRPRPVSVELLHKQDIKFILDNRFDLPSGIYVDKEYPIDIECKRKTLLPVLRAAKQLSNYKKQSRLDDDKLVLKGRSYNVNTLNQLPDELNVFKVTSKENENTVGFFGEINLLSNFYPSTFLYDRVQYISSEQLIQANKAKFFGDLETYNQILCCSSSLECKRLSRQIRNVDETKWEEEAGNICLPGIHAKFYQNPVAMDTLLYKTGKKRIVECASDRLWANGMPLGDPACLDSAKWISQGILGQILECICSEVTKPRGQLYHQLPPSIIPNLVGQQSASISIPETNLSIGTSNSSEPRPIPSAADTTITDESALTTDSTSTSTSSTPVSDTTASDTNQSELQPQQSTVQDEPVQMEDTPVVDTVPSVVINS